MNNNTVVVSSTDLKRKYNDVKKMLGQNLVVIITNRNSDGDVDGILLPYSEMGAKKAEELLEDIEMEKNKTHLIKEFQKSYLSGKGKRIPLDTL